MATKATRRKKATAPEPEVAETVEEDEDVFEELDEDTDTDEDATDEADEDGDEDGEDDDLEELDEPEEEEAPAKPTKKAKTSKTGGTTKAKTADVPAFGSKELAEHITATTGQAYDARSVRMLLRKLAKQEDGPLRRAIGEDRARYSFTGPSDPAVKAIVQMVKSGEAQKIKREGLDAVKAKADGKKAAKKAAVEEVEEVEETPAKKVKKTKKTSTAAAPAKAKASKKAKS